VYICWTIKTNTNLKLNKMETTIATRTENINGKEINVKETINQDGILIVYVTGTDINHEIEAVTPDNCIVIL